MKPVNLEGIAGPAILSNYKEAGRMKAVNDAQLRKIDTDKTIRTITTILLIVLLVAGIGGGGYYTYSRWNVIGSGYTNWIHKIDNANTSTTTSPNTSLLAQPANSCEDIGFSVTPNLDGTNHFNILPVNIGKCYNIPVAARTSWYGLFTDSAMIDKYAAKVYSGSKNPLLIQDQISSAVKASLNTNIFDLRVP